MKRGNDDEMGFLEILISWGTVETGFMALRLSYHVS